jgi:hypothetical protein
VPGGKIAGRAVELGLPNWAGQSDGGEELIPDLGVMLAAYMFTRLIQIVLRTDEGTDGVITKVVALLAVIVVIFTALDLVSRGQSFILPTPP